MKRRNCALFVVVLFAIIVSGLHNLSIHIYGPAVSVVQALANVLSSFYDSIQSGTAQDVEQSHQNNGTSDVLISTYMRSGSSFLGRILGWRKDSFYIYEPLWKEHLWQFFRDDGRLCGYLTPQCSVNDTFLKRAEDFLKDIYQCRLAIHSDFVYEHIHAHQQRTAHSWEPFRSCRSQNRSVKECLSELEPTCQTARHRVIKVLRMDFLPMGELLSALPRLTVILLLRDPRGILNSHLRTPWFPMNFTANHEFENDAKVACSRIERDLHSADLLTKRFRDRVKIVQYEDLRETLENTNSLYRAMGMEQLNNSMIEKLWNVFSDPVQHDSFSFRNTMSWDVMKIIDKHCSNLYSKLGLVQYKDLNHLRNRTFPSIIGNLSYTLH